MTSTRLLFVLTLLVTAIGGGARAADDASAVRALVESSVSAISKVRASRVATLSGIASHGQILEYFKSPEGERKAQLPAVKSFLKDADMGSELCLIDNQGVEHLRVVRGRFASDKELSKEEMDAPFFAPGMVLREGQSYQSNPYFSPDVEEWVLGVAVPVIPGQAILHFEHPVKEYHDALASAVGGGHLALAVDRVGHIVINSRDMATSRPADLMVNPRTYFLSIRRGEGAMPAEVVRAMLAGEPGEAQVTWRGANYLMAWKPTDGLTIAVLEPAH
ncbi:MAG: hypothetical protein H7840_10930 [Alphaproteobacteria bacterium]